ncbi:clan AA aspartic protease [Mucilaginibacter pallidiroseus]|uniref:Clan AA aspartic protease n=1 Tax=Mucilaginibacter pallidiroseus TaxID=2599295 RepID=A0A563UD16_9SPHI|nr:aspartyl protease family protein [Mucilaginibacter pallidiroseus]TWR29255.1 clan AA aspartic protease [Mucilaginibacter pallidiroseus]
MLNNTTVTIPLNIIDLHDGFHPLLQIQLFNQVFNLVLDTGASRTAFDHQLLLMANEHAPIIASEKLSTGLGTNTMASATAKVKDIAIGELLIPELEVAVLDLSTINIAYAELGHPEVLGVLGSDVLMEYNAVIDYGKMELILHSA